MVLNKAQSGIHIVCNFHFLSTGAPTLTPVLESQQHCPGAALQHCNNSDSDRMSQKKMLYTFKYTEIFPLIHKFSKTYILGKLNV